MVDMNFAEKLTRWIDRAGKSQSQLMRETGIAQTSISAMTRGERRPYLDQAQKLARALGVSLDYLADDALDDPPSPVLSLTPEDRLVLNLVHQLGHAEALRRLATAPPRPGDRVPVVRAELTDEAAPISRKKRGPG